jgi:hypothetical protein
VGRGCAVDDDDGVVDFGLDGSVELTFVADDFGLEEREGRRG